MTRRLIAWLAAYWPLLVVLTPAAAALLAWGSTYAP